jgi:hypothetical protein
MIPKEIQEAVDRYNNPPKERIVFNRVANHYSIMDTNRKERIEREF